MAKSTFKLQHPLDKRQAEAGRIREKYPDRIPVIVEKAKRSDVPDVEKKKYLVQADLTVGQFVSIIRKRISLTAEKAIFIFVKNTLPPTAALMSSLYEDHRDEDGFLYMTYSGENTFGSLEMHLNQICIHILNSPNDFNIFRRMLGDGGGHSDYESRFPSGYY